jgi:MerR family transcriptional regulator, copper efflux regulator
MRISELATRTGVGVHALRHYERVGLLRVARRPNGYRDYDERVVRDVVFIVHGRRMGFTLKQLGEDLPAYRAGRLTIEHGLDALHARIAELDRQIAAHQKQRLELLGHVERLKQRQQREEQRRIAPQATSAGGVIWPSPRRTKERR